MSSPRLIHSKSGQAVSHQPESAKYFNLVNDVMHFTHRERTMLQRNSFVVTERLMFNQFKRAFAYLYWKDLPVLVTTDAILHSIHQTYDEMLKQLEMTLLTDHLHKVLSHARRYLRNAAKQNTDPRLTLSYADLEIYLSVPLALLRHWPFPNPEKHADHYATQIRTINSSAYHYNGKYHIVENGKFVERAFDRVGVEKVALFGFERDVDFTQFQARGHYTENPELTTYFMAMMWLALIDFRFIDYDLQGQPIFRVGQLVAAYLLREAIHATRQRQRWDEINTLLTAFVGWSDNITLNGLDQVFEDAGITSPAMLLDFDPARLIDLLLHGDYGQQQIRGQIQRKRRDNTEVLPHPVSFMLMGQRFTIESYVMQEVIYDHLKVNGQEVRRAYPSSLDVMAALGNDRALDHLSGEFHRFGYQARLAELQQEIASYSHEWWESSFYNLWLDAIRALNVDHHYVRYPVALRSDAWGDKMLHTQLASWTQLRHDNILYAKPPYAPRVGCEFPAGYVEPYPAFYAALGRYARFGREVFQQIKLPQRKMTYDEAKAHAKARDLGWREEHFLRTYRLTWVYEQTLTYFDHLEKVAGQLESISRKELAGEAFSEEDNLFLRSVLVRKYAGDTRYGGYTEEDWNGWYNDLLPFGDDSPALVADLFTNFNEKLGPLGVLHVGTREPVLAALLVEEGDHQALYVGPVFTFCEHFEEGYPPRRLTDEEWIALNLPGDWAIRYAERRLALPNHSDAERADLEVELQEEKKKYQAKLRNRSKGPAWTASFRLRSNRPELLDMPGAWELIDPDASLQNLLRLPENEDKVKSFRHLFETVRDNPRELLKISGLDEQMYAELMERFRVNGYLG